MSNFNPVYFISHRSKCRCLFSYQSYDSSCHCWVFVPVLTLTRAWKVSHIDLLFVISWYKSESAEPVQQFIYAAEHNWMLILLSIVACSASVEASAFVVFLQSFIHVFKSLLCVFQTCNLCSSARRKIEYIFEPTSCLNLNNTSLHAQPNSEQFVAVTRLSTSGLTVKSQHQNKMHW